MTAAGHAELRAALREGRGLFAIVGVFSVFVNLLLLTGPVYMLQVYDRVLGSRSTETLVALTILMGFLFAILGLLDFSRTRILSRVGARLQAALDPRVFEATLRRAAQIRPADRGGGDDPVHDLEALRTLLGAPAFLALYDLPFTPLFLGVIALFHPWLGVLALTGAIVLAALAGANQAGARSALTAAATAGAGAERHARELLAEAGSIGALGLMENARDRWSVLRSRHLALSVAAGDIAGACHGLSRTLRLFLQSAMLGLGAYLVLRNEATAGVMIAASIMLGRALAPVDLLIGQWPLVLQAWKGWGRLAGLLDAFPAEPPRTALPRPAARLSIRNLTVVPPGRNTPSLQRVSAELAPGQVLGVIGPSGSGKSTLARAVTGVWQPAGGSITLGGAAVDQYAPGVLARHIGYLPQQVRLFEGTIAQNIARFADAPDSARTVSAATRAGAHALITKLPEGYDTPVHIGGCQLSGGQIQRIGLARALYGDPVLLVLDEPDAHLDGEGTQALRDTILAMKGTGNAVMIMAHRPAAIHVCDTLLILDGGGCRAFGPREQVLREHVENHAAITRLHAAAGGR